MSRPWTISSQLRCRNTKWRLGKAKLKRKSVLLLLRCRAAAASETFLSTSSNPLRALVISMHLRFSRKPITITAERLSDNSRITFTISSDKTIKQLRALLNHHLPPLSPGRFDLYSYQRGALIHFHPSSFKLDYFPVIFDQSVLVLQMDDRPHSNIDSDAPGHRRTKLLKASSNKDSCVVFSDLLSSRRNSKSKSFEQQMSSSSSSPVTCLTILKQFFHRSSAKSVTSSEDTNLLTSWEEERSSGSLVTTACSFRFLFCSCSRNRDMAQSVHTYVQNLRWLTRKLRTMIYRLHFLNVVSLQLDAICWRTHCAIGDYICASSTQCFVDCWSKCMSQWEDYRCQRTMTNCRSISSHMSRKLRYG